jgi:hypothetical protein
MILSFVQLLFLQLAVAVCSLLHPNITAHGFAMTAQQARTGKFGTREENVYAPGLYASDIDLIVTLVDLPGAKKKKSYWELSYQVYFIPEGKYYEALDHMPPGASNPGPDQFSGKVIIAEGHEKKSDLATLKERTLVINRLPFKNKIPDVQRTKFARLMTSYSVKIFDAELNTTVYHSGIFLTKPYEENPGLMPRKSIYLNFMVSPQGTLNRSQSARKIGDTTW